MRRTLLSTAAVLAAVSVTGAVVVHRARVAAGPAVPVPTVAVAPPPVEPGPTPAVAKPGRPMSVVSIDGHDAPFPAANLTVTRGRGGLHAVLCTDDPPAALQSGYTDNSFMFDMVVPVDAPADLPLATWQYQPDQSSDATGIYLHGNRDQLQPTADVRVAFAPDAAGTLLATITGTFVKLDTRDPTAPPERVSAYAVVRCLAARR